MLSALGVTREVAMPVQLSYPGVYVEEVPSAVRSITGVATSITAFVGRAVRGPVDSPVTVTSFGEFERVFGGLWASSRLAFSVRDFFLNGGGQAVVVRVFRTVNGQKSQSELSVGTLKLAAAEPGSWGDALAARVDHTTRPHDTSRAETNASLFNLFITDGTTGVAEEHRNVVVAPATHPRLVSRVLANESRLVRVTEAGDARPDAGSGKVEDAGKATDGDALTSAEFIGSESAKRGVFALDNADLINLLVIPPYLATDSVDTTVITNAAAYCERRRAVLLLDPLPTWDEAKDLTDAFTAGGFPDDLGTNSKNAALYFPRLRQANPLRENQIEPFPPAGAVAGVIARTDAQRGVWKAPAGLEAGVVGISALAVPLTDAEIGRLNPIGVNCLRTAPGAGPVVWGARTMQGPDLLASQWKYLPVRRTALFLEESLYRGLQWVVFEPNDEALWAQIRLNVGTFLNDLFRQGAFQGTTPRAAYFVKCDRTTTTQSDVDLGIVNVHVGFAPLKPAEFVVLRVQQMAGQTAV